MIEKIPFIVYIDGELVDTEINSITVSYGVNSIPTASIAFPPDDSLINFGEADRVHVAIFYLDKYYGDEPKFRLLFDGEIAGYSYTKTAVGKNLVLNCVGHINILTYIYMHYTSNISQIAQATLEEKIGAAASTIAQARVVMPYSLFKHGLFFEPGDPVESTIGAFHIKRPYDFILNLFRGLISSDLREEERTIPGVNFFARWIYLNRFNQRFAALPLFDKPRNDGEPFPLLKAVQGSLTVQALAQSLTQLGSGASFADILNMVASSMEMEIISIPPAPAFCVDRADYTYKSHFDDYGADKVRILAQNLFKPKFEYAIPPRFNIIFPSMLTGFTFNRAYFSEPTRMYTSIEGEPLKHLLPDAETQEISESVLSRGYPELIDRMIHRNSKQNNSMYNILLYPIEYFKGPAIEKVQAPSWLWYLEIQSRKEVNTNWYSRFLKDLWGMDPTSMHASLTPEMQIAGVLNNLMKPLDVGYLYLTRQFYARKYGSRSLATNPMVFNPYLVPGFPCLIIDSHPGMIFLGYVKSVTHTYSNSGTLQTTAVITHPRHIYEVFWLLKKQIDKNFALYAIAPLDPVPDVRDYMQIHLPADEFYNTLFYTKEKGRKSAVWWPDLFEWERDGKTTPLEMKGIEDIKSLEDWLDHVISFIKIAYRVYRDMVENEVVNGGDIEELVVLAEQMGVPELGQHISRNMWSVEDFTFLMEEFFRYVKSKLNPQTNLDYHEFGYSLVLRKEVQDRSSTPLSALRYVARPIIDLESYFEFICEGREEYEELKKDGNIVYVDGVKVYKKLFKRKASSSLSIPPEDIQRFFVDDIAKYEGNLGEKIKDWAEVIKRYKKKVGSIILEG